MLYNKIQPSQINLDDFITDKRLGIYLTNVINTNGSSAISVVRYNAIGDIDPVESFATLENNVTITLEWEGLNKLWDGNLFVNGLLVERTNPNANFIALTDSRRFRCVYTLNIIGLTSLNFYITNETGIISVSNTIPITEFLSANITSFRFTQSKLNDWYLPSRGELELMRDNLHLTSSPVGNFTNNWFWSSSEQSSTQAWRVFFGSVTNASVVKTNTSNRTRAVRTFISNVVLEIKDETPTGFIFHKVDNGNGTFTYYECAKTNQSNSATWSNVTNQLVGQTSTSVGRGKLNTERIISQAGHIDSSAQLCVNLNGISYFGDYPYNRIYTIIDEVVTEQYIEQTFCKKGDYVQYRIVADKPFTRIKLNDVNNAFGFGNNYIIDLTSATNIYEGVLCVDVNTNISNVTISAEVYSSVYSVWSPTVNTNKNATSLNMEDVININNDIPSGTSNVNLTKLALDKNDNCEIAYTISPSVKWLFMNLSTYNINFANTFTFTNLTLNSLCRITIHNNLNEYNLNKQFVMPIIDERNGKIGTISSTIPVATISPTVTWNVITLNSRVGGKTHTLSATFNQQLKTTQPISVTILATPDTNINLSNFRYNGNNQILLDVNILDLYLRGNLTIRLNNVMNLSDKTNNYTNTYVVRGFESRTLIGTVGNNELTLNVNILDEVGFNAILDNNSSPMNYKNWNGGAVLSTDAMTKTTGLIPSDQYAYTFNPTSKKIILSAYIMTYLLNNAPVVTISKT